jgi:asparagine synthase (glutamine-hydrolysing)
MAHAIEGRTPFLDHSLFETVGSIPERFKIHDGVDKYVLREAYKSEVTEAIYRREKWPFSAPPLWVKKGLYPMLDQLIDRYLCRSAIEKTGIFNYNMIRRCRLFTRLCFFDCDFKRRLNQVLIFVLTIQIIDDLYIQNFASNQVKRKK